jgi:hypothetical protein
MATPKKKAAQEVVVSYKGFDKELCCHPDGGERVQYEVGKTYKLDGDIEACKRGFHACEYPLDVFGYYPPAGSRFACVKQSGQISRHNSDSKVASSKIKVSAELGLPGIIKAAVEYTFSRAKPEGERATGDRSAASATGDCSAASATGDRSAASATGDCSAASATGDQSAASATGDQSAASATDDHSAASATGNRSAASATGYQSAASATGSRSAASATGNRSAASATGYQSAASATGDQSAASATGYRSAASATGYRSAASATGDQSAASATGYRSAASATGAWGTALATGYEGRVMGKEGNALFLVERNDVYEIVSVWAGIAGRDGIKPDTFYLLRDSKPVEV